MDLTQVSPTKQTLSCRSRSPNKQASSPEKEQLHLQSSDIHLTPQRAHSAKPRAWERQPRATTQRCGKTKRVWKRPLQQRQGPNGQTSQNNIDATASLQAFDRTPQKALKKARITNNGAARAHADNGHVGSKVITRDWIRNRMPHKKRAILEQKVDEMPRFQDEVMNSQSSEPTHVDNGITKNGTYQEPIEFENAQDALGEDIAGVVNTPSLVIHEDIHADGRDLSPRSELGSACEDWDTEPTNVEGPSDTAEDNEQDNEALPLVQSSQGEIDVSSAQGNVQEADSNNVEKGLVLAEDGSESFLSEEALAGDMTINIDDCFSTSLGEDIQEEESDMHMSRPPRIDWEFGPDLVNDEFNYSLSPAQRPTTKPTQGQAEDCEREEEESDDSSSLSSPCNGDLEQPLTFDIDTLRPQRHAVMPSTTDETTITSPTANLDYEERNAELSCSPGANPPLTPSRTTTPPLNDDEMLLHDFVNRAKASKAAKIAEQEHADHRRDSDVVKHALARDPLGETDGKSPLEGKPSQEDSGGSPTLRLDVLPRTAKRAADEREDKQEESQPQRAKRQRSRDSSQGQKEATTRPAADSAVSVFNLRRHADRRPTVSQRTEAQKLGQTTKSNTRRNKTGSLSVKETLSRLQGETAATSPPTHIAHNGAKRRRSVTWDEELVKVYECERKEEEEEEGLVRKKRKRSAPPVERGGEEVGLPQNGEASGFGSMACLLPRVGRAGTPARRLAKK